MSSVLSVSRSQLERLSDVEAVDIFAGLLWADSAARGIAADIDIPRNTDARDGGIDATVKAPADMVGKGVIGPGVTRYQIKSGRGFNPASGSARRRLLFRPVGDGLRPRIKNCLDNGETLVVVAFGTDAPGTEHDLEDLIREDLAKVDPSYGRAKVEVWLQSKLIGYIEKYPALRRRLTGTSNALFLAHPQWALASKDMARHFVLGPSQKNLIDKARATLRNVPGWADVRIAGRPGSGKTRIAYEITRADDLAAITLYFENPSHARRTSFLESLIEDDDARAILVVDECDWANWKYFQDSVAQTGGRIKLVTMYNKKDTKDCYELEDLGLAEIKKIIEKYGADVSGDVVGNLASKCKPSPRYAHHFAEMMALDPGGFLASSPLESAIHEHYIRTGLGPQESESARKRKLALLQFCIFSRVGYEGKALNEYEFLKKKCGQEDGIAPNEFDSIVDDLRELKILQGYKALYIAPYMLHLWLWSEWWRLRGRGPAPAALLSAGGGGGSDEMPHSLRRAFREMASDDTRPEIAASAGVLLDGDGPFDEGGGSALEDSDRAETFSALARANPDSALRLLKRTVCRWDDRRLGRFGEGRRHVVWAVEHIAERSKDLEAVVGVLLPLAVNENEQGLANSATGVLARLFVMAPGALAGTLAGLEERLALLAKILAHKDGRIRALSLAACDSALESVHESRLDYERDNVSWNPTNWKPSAAEADAYGRVISMLCGKLSADDRGEGRTAASIVLKRAAELSRFRDLSDAAVDALRAVLESGAADRREVARTAELVLRRNEGRMGAGAAAACRRLAAELSGDDYRSRMRRYVGVDIPPGTSSLPDQSGVEAIEKAVRGLAAESLRDRDALLGQADWLFGPAVGHAHLFGRELAVRDAGCSLLPDLLDAMSRSGAELSDLMIGGYLGEVSIRSPDLWESAVDTMERNERLAPLVPGVTWWSRVTDRSWARLVRMRGRGAVQKDAFAMFARGGRACALSDKAFGEALGIVLEEATAGDMRDALALLSGRCECADPKRAIPAEAACRVALDDAFLSGPQDGNLVGPVNRYWATVVKRLARDDPGRIPRMAGAVFWAMGLDDGIFSGPCDEAIGALDAMAEMMPERVWECAAAHLTAPPDKRAHRILEWASGRFLRATHRRSAARRTLLDMVAPESVCAWVDGDRVARASLIAEFAPRDVSDHGSIARRLLALYGGHKEVRDALHQNFKDEVWVYPGAGYYARARARCKEIAAAEADSNVHRWLSERIKIIDGAMAEERALEARM